MKRRKFARLNTDKQQLKNSIDSLEELLKVYGEAKEVDSTVAILMSERGWDKRSIIEAQQEGYLYSPSRNTILAPPESSFPS